MGLPPHFLPGSRHAFTARILTLAAAFALVAFPAAAQIKINEIFPNPLRDPMWFDLPAEQPLIKDGFMHLPTGSGFGMPLRQDVIDRYRADR